MLIFVFYFTFELKFEHKKRKKRITTMVNCGARTIYENPPGQSWLLQDLDLSDEPEQVPPLVSSTFLDLVDV